MVARWALQLQTFDFHVDYKLGTKNCADALSRNIPYLVEPSEEKPFRLGNLTENHLPSARVKSAFKTSKCGKSKFQETHELLDVLDDKLIMEH